MQAKENNGEKKNIGELHVESAKKERTIDVTKKAGREQREDREKE